jgi:N-acetyl-beta-hexosaminidase
LTAKASDSAVGGNPGGFYTREDYRAIVEHAAARHMIVVPEFDVPGHTHAIGLAYPEIAEDPVLNEHIEEFSEGFGEQPPTRGVPYTGMGVGFSSLKIDEEETYRFLEDVFGEVAEITPGPYLHLGGDEALGTAPEDFARFLARATRIVADLGKTPVTWHEAGAAPLAPGTVGQYWGLRTPSEDAARTAAAFIAAGSRLICSPADAIYLDMKYDDDTRIGLTWADGPTSVERSYAWEPTAILESTTDDDILGVEAPLWTETVRTAADIDELAFPRLAAAAEIGWSPARSEERSWESFRVRVGAQGPLWSALGIGFHASPEIPWARE